MTDLVLRDVEVDGRRVDVTVAGGLVRAVEPTRSTAPPPPARAVVIDGGGGALLPGLWDHHIHLVALAAARTSVAAGPPDVLDTDTLARALRTVARSTDDRSPQAWIRAVGYHESVAGDLDRHGLDRLVADVPVRLQHRSGAAWILNSAALARIGLDPTAPHRAATAGDVPAGVERAADGTPTGRLFGVDDWLRSRLDDATGDTTGERRAAPDLAAVGRELARYGVVGVTDATPYARPSDLDLLASATSTGALPQRVVAMGGPALTDHDFPAPLRPGPVKLLLADHSLPALDDLVRWIGVAHEAGRAVAAHSVTRASLVLLLAALDVAGAGPGDRVEHGAVVPPELHGELRRHGLTVVTQPNFVCERGDRYLVDAEPDDRPHLYPCAGLLAADVPVAASTDAPFGHPDPWRALAAATTRRTAGGRTLGPDERVDHRRALDLLLGPPDDPGGPPRRVEAGAPADLCLLHEPLAALDAGTTCDVVRTTVIGGRVVPR